MLYEFYTGVYGAVDDPSTNSIISWSKSNKTFVIWDQEELMRRQIFKRYCCGTIAKLTRMLNLFGFKKVKWSRHLEFGHKYFVRGHPELMEKLQLENEAKLTKRYRAKAVRAKAKASKADQGAAAADCVQNLRI